jgi:hypothetical protein
MGVFNQPHRSAVVLLPSHFSDAARWLRFWISLAAALIVAFWFWFSGFSPDLLRSAETKAFIPALFDFLFWTG